MMALPLLRVQMGISLCPNALIINYAEWLIVLRLVLVLYGKFNR